MGWIGITYTKEKEDDTSRDVEIASIWRDASPLRAELAIRHRDSDGGHGRLFILLTAPVLELVRRLAQDAGFKPDALLAAAICPEIVEKYRKIGYVMSQHDMHGQD